MRVQVMQFENPIERVVIEKMVDKRRGGAADLHRPDGSGLWFKSWTSFVRRSKPENFVKSPYDVPGFSDMMKKWERVVGDPIRWYEKWLHYKGFAGTDGVAHEMWTLSGVPDYASRVGQRNLQTSVAFEIIAHRFHEIEGGLLTRF